MPYKILFSNIGYARGIDGSLAHHIAYMPRHIYTPPLVQERVLSQLRTIIDSENPDLCCFVEIDRGSMNTGRYDQIAILRGTDYKAQDISDKYGPQNILSRMPFHTGKCNAFLAKENLEFERKYLAHGSKRLLYSLILPGNIRLFFAHFSLNRKVRLKQFHELKQLIKGEHDVIVLADFNIMRGFSELDPLMVDTDLQIINRDNEYTFRFHKYERVLDLCLCSKSLASKLSLKIIPQPFSDHAALLVEI